jgi:hypothetical protein
MVKDTFNPFKRILEALVSSAVMFRNDRGEIALTDGDNVTENTAVNNWRDSLPAEIKSHPVFEKYKEPNEAFKALVDAQKFLGREKLPVPTGPDDKETYGMIFKTLGLPDKPDGYVISEAGKKDIPADVQLDETMFNDFKRAAHENGILPQQFEGLYKWYINSVKGQMGKMNEQRTVEMQKSETELRNKWGKAYDENVSVAQRVFKQFADEKAIGEIEKGLGNNPVMIELFANIGKVLSEDKLKGKGSSFTMTPDEAKSEVNKFMGDTKSPYWDESHPLHKETVERVKQLFSMMV